MDSRDQVFTLGIALIFLSSSVLVYFTDDVEEGLINNQSYFYPDLFDRHELEWNMSGTHSYLLEKGPYSSLEVQEAFIDVDTSSVWETGPSNAIVHLSYWLPSNTEAGDKVPVIAIVSPYFDYGGPDGGASTPTNVVGAARGEFIFENFVPWGYAFAQVAVFGTEESTGCFDYRGHGEQLGIDAAVTWLGEQNWSNGNVGLYGKSYEGATQWEAALAGNPYLKTIVPISGTTSTKTLLFKNGSAEARSQVMHGAYFINIVDFDESDADHICPDVADGFTRGERTYLEPRVDIDLDYWEERDYRQRSIDNYQGSVYFVQGLQDWNVDSHMIFPLYQQMKNAGFDVKGIFGQWGHDYPDQWQKHDDIDNNNGGTAFPQMTRWDWGQDLFEWFEYYLQERGPKPDLNVQVQRHDGLWRIEDTYPSQDSEKIVLENFTASCKSLVGNWWPLVFNCPVDVTAFVNLTHPGFDYDVHISGMPTLELDVTASGDFGQVFATLYDDTENVRLGHATMDIRYNEGGEDPSGVVVSGQSVTMQMEFFAIDAFLPAGHELRIDLTGSGKDYLPPPCPPVGLCTVDYQAAKLTLPISNTPEEHYFNVPYWNPIEE
ncbi:MAG: CocE/NonD family hydrolase [Candidatus Poseidoniales archaeon]